MPPNTQFLPVTGAPREFHTTRWSIVAAAGAQAPQSREALESLCQSYWQPLVQFAQRSPRQWSPPRDAEDAVQSFFVWLIETNVLARADARRGRFRTFLLAAFQQFQQREHAFWTAKKRYPGGQVVSLDAGAADHATSLEPYHECTPDRNFDRDWALQVLERAMHRLCQEWTRAGRLDRFQILQGHMVGKGTGSGEELARQLKMTEGAARVALFRLKQQFASILRDEIAQTVASAAEIDAELAHLREALGGG